MTEKQKYLLKLLQEVDEICREHGLRYVLAGGSLIGALRHEGFVPWDDAIDLYMPRPDWEKFVEICKRVCRRREPSSAHRQTDIIPIPIPDMHRQIPVRSTEARSQAKMWRER